MTTRAHLLLSMRPQVKPRRYLYGLRLGGETFVIRAGKTSPPADATVTREITGTSEEAQKKAELLAKGVDDDLVASVLHGEVSMAADVDLLVGSVAVHKDGDVEHVCVVIETGHAMTKALFFSSKPTWSEKWRRATKEELALAAYRQSSATYLALAERPTHAFEPTGLTFPDHRVEALRAEFLGPSLLRSKREGFRSCRGKMRHGSREPGREEAPRGTRNRSR